jgi:hypothetical protein
MSSHLKKWGFYYRISLVLMSILGTSLISLNSIVYLLSIFDAADAETPACRAVPDRGIP